MPSDKFSPYLPLQLSAILSLIRYGKEERERFRCGEITELILIQRRGERNCKWRMIVAAYLD